VKRSDRLERCGVGTEVPSDDGEDEGIVDDSDGDAAFVESEGEAAVGS
jgi:hypothetical protein